MNNPKVSVCIVTYKQEKYIKQCVESILNQDVDFPFEVIVGDDCSTDKTLEILKSISIENTNLFIIERKKNIGGSANYIDTHKRSKGVYTCHCDGDDYWLPNKLKLQVNAMDSTPNCNLSWTRAVLVNPQGIIKEDLNNNVEFLNNRFTRASVIRYMALGVNSSLMYRTDCKIGYLPSFDILDWYANIERIGDGVAIYASDIPLTAYRTFVGVSSAGNKVLNVIAKTMNLLSLRYPQHKSDLALVALLSSYSAFKKKEFILASKFLSLSLKCSIKGGISLKEIKIFLEEVKFLKIR